MPLPAKTTGPVGSTLTGACYLLGHLPLGAAVGLIVFFLGPNAVRQWLDLLPGRSRAPQPPSTSERSQGAIH